MTRSTMTLCRLLVCSTVLTVAVCSCASEEVSDDDEPVEPIDITQLGAACGAGGCPADLTCMTYGGLDGTEFSTCEIPCSDDPGACPAGTTCFAIADGPGQVCRAD